MLILCSGIRPCASQIYPYVTKKLRVPGGYQPVEMQVPQSIPLFWQFLPQESATLLAAYLLFDWICFSLSCTGLTHLQGFLSSAQFLLQCSDVRGLACHSCPCRATVSCSIPSPSSSSLFIMPNNIAPGICGSAQAGGGTRGFIKSLLRPRLMPHKTLKQPSQSSPLKLYFQPSAGSMT